MKKLPRTLLLLAWCMLCTLCAKSAPVDSAAACRVAETFFGKSATAKLQAHDGRSTRSATLLHTFPSAYVATKGERFVLIHRDDELPEVLGYGTFSETSSTEAEGNGTATRALPPALRTMLRSATANAQRAVPYAGEFHAVDPLLTTIRHQSAPYNKYCPHYRKSDGTWSEAPCLVGCVATAMEQILTYHRLTYTLRDTLHGWETNRYTIADVLPGESVDTRLIRDNYDTNSYTEEEADAVARLSYWLGVASHMQWGLSSSGTYSSRLVEPLRNAFGLPYVHLLDASRYAPSVYWQFLANEVMAHRPVYFAGSIEEGGGHAFVLDGLDTDGLFHVNWGYGGDFDGFFRLDVLWYAQPEAERKDTYINSGFFCEHEAIVVGTEPLPDTLLPDTLQRDFTEVTVEAIRFADTPMTNRYTAVDMDVRNTSDTQTLYTSFALFQNAPTDTALIEQAELLAMSAATLAPGEKRTLRLNARFTQGGPLLVSVTTDGTNILGTTPVTAVLGNAVAFTTDTPQIEIRPDRSIVIRQRIANASATERASQMFQYELTDEQNGTQWRLPHYIYLQPSEEVTDTICYPPLNAGHNYTLNLRQRWPIVQTVRFSVPGTDGIGEAVDYATDTAEVQWYTLSGVRLNGRPTQRGVYLKRQGTSVKKVLVTNEAH